MTPVSRARWIEPPQCSRRRFLKSAGWASAGLLAAQGWGPSLVRAQETGRHLRIEQIDRTTVRLPYREIPRRAMDRELPHWRYVEIFEVQLSSGVVGIGETLLYYTWGVSDDGDVQRALGKNAAALMWDDSLGAGLQMALFDGVARTLNVPVHRLLGPQRNQQTPLSWWNIDMPPDDLAAECHRAHAEGYRSFKTKGRPWFDLWEQVEAVSRVVPEHFKLDMDFNDTLRDAERAIPILTELEADPRLDIYETPIPQSDIPGNQAIRAATRVNLALHYGNPPPKQAVCQEVCDGFVVGGGASRVLQRAAVCATVDMPFWLQLVGTGITAAFSLHFGAVCSHARWPAVNCHQLYEHDLIQGRIEVEEGFAAVPQRPGLGYDLNREVVERFRVEKPALRPDPPRILETRFRDGRRLFVASNNQVNFMLNAANRGQVPFFQRGVMTRLLPDDGTDAWRQRYERACQAPFFE